MNANDVTLPFVALAQITTGGDAPLRGLSLSVQRGEIVSLLGDEAASVVAVVAGFQRPQSGELILNGRFGMDIKPSQRRIGMVSRRLDLFAHLSVRGHARFAPGVTRDMADTILARLDLLAVADRAPLSLSGEQQLRVALARALARKPDLLLLDDPFAGAAPSAIDAIKTWLRREAAQSGLSVLHSAGDASDAFGLADRIGVIENGQLRQYGTAQELYERPESLFVARQTGPLNQLHGTIVSQEDDIAAVRLAGGAIVEGRVIGSLRNGEACTLAIRPERIAIAAMKPVDLGEGALAAQLCEAVFVGDHMRLALTADLRGGETAELVVIRPSGATLPRNGGISLAWQAHHAHVFARKAP